MDTAAIGPSLKLSEFLKLEGIGKTSFHKIPEEIRPRISVVPGTTIRVITAAERAAYHERLAEYQRENADRLEAERRERSEKFSELGKLAAESPRHPCQRKKNNKRRRRG